MEDESANNAKAAAVIAIGSCATWGGVPSAGPNPTGATPVYKILEGTGIPVINIPGCPPRPETVIDALMKLQASISTEKQQLVARHCGKQAHPELPKLPGEPIELI